MWATGGTSGQNGGSILGWAGYGGVSGVSGRVEFIGGTGDNVGGAAIMRGGPSDGAGATGGEARLIGGSFTNGNNNESGGDAIVAGGDASGATAVAGNAVIRGGFGQFTGPPGKVLIGPGNDTTTEIIVGDADAPGTQDMIVHANFMAQGISGATTNIRS